MPVPLTCGADGFARENTPYKSLQSWWVMGVPLLVIKLSALNLLALGSTWLALGVGTSVVVGRRGVLILEYQ